MKYIGEETRQRDVSDQKQDSSIQIAILTIRLQSSAIQGEDLVEGYKELERGLCNARNPQQSCNPTSLKDNDKTQMHPFLLLLKRPR